MTTELAEIRDRVGRLEAQMMSEFGGSESEGNIYFRLRTIKEAIDKAVTLQGDQFDKEIARLDRELKAIKIDLYGDGLESFGMINQWKIVLFTHNKIRAAIWFLIGACLTGAVQFFLERWLR